MTWQRNYVTLGDGTQVRYSLAERAGAGVYFVRFKGRDGRRLEKSTGQVKKAQATDAAHRIIAEEYGDRPDGVPGATWAEAREQLRAALAADGKRPRTIGGYLETLAKVAAQFPRATGPGEITASMAGEFKTRYAAGRFTRKKKVAKGKVAPSYARKAKSLDSRVRTLKAVFGWLLSLGLVAENPFVAVTLPELDRHEVKYVRPEDIAAFFAWLAERYPDWDMPRLFFSVKALTACRLQDICSIRSSQLQDGRLVFAADTAKTRSERYAALPADLYAELDAYKGKSFLWEGYPAQLREATVQRGRPVHTLNPEFSPRRLYLWVIGLMQDYQRETGKHLSSHDFRKAAFTRAAEKDVHPKRAAAAFDVTAETMLRYYTATDKKKVADEVFGELADDLLPKKGRCD